MIIQGKIRWCKLQGAPSWGFENSFKEWSADVYVDEQTIEKLKTEGLEKRIKTSRDGEQYVKFSRKELKKDGTPNKPIRIVGPDGKTEFPSSQKIGNGSTVNVNFAINENARYGNLTNILSMQVYELVEYQKDEFEANPNAVASVGEDWSE